MSERHDRLTLRDVAKSFTLHLRGGVTIDVVRDVSFTVRSGECVVLTGPSGAGKSSILKMVYGNYRCDGGFIGIRDGEEVVDVTRAEPRRILALRRTAIGYVSQFLRVIPRVSAVDVVSAAARESGASQDEGRDRAERLLAHLNIPRQLWPLPPATFSGGEQQRVNIARGFAAERPILLLDEPTASLDATNRALVVELIRERTEAGVAVLGIFHDDDVRDSVADRMVDMSGFAERRAA